MLQHRPLGPYELVPAPTLDGLDIPMRVIARVNGSSKVVSPSNGYHMSLLSIVCCFKLLLPTARAAIPDVELSTFPWFIATFPLMLPQTLRTRAASEVPPSQTKTKPFF